MALFFDHALLPGGWCQNVRIELHGGRILSASPGSAPDSAQHVRGIALPGLPNLHSHTFQRGMAGLAERRGSSEDNFWTWRQVMYHFLGTLSPEDVQTIAAFAFMEMLERGFTSVAEFHYLHHAPDGKPYGNLAELSERIVAAAAETGIGLTLLPVLYSSSGFGGAAPAEGQRRFPNDLDRFLLLCEKAEACARKAGAALGVAPHSLRAVPPEALKALLEVRTAGPVHIHVAEQLCEVEDCLAWSGMRPVEWLLGHVPVDQRWCLIHATHTNENEIEGMAKSGAVAGLCPITEANLGDGIFAAKAYLGRGGAFGVGSDSQIEINAPGELRQLEYSQRLKHMARNVLAAGDGGSAGRVLYDRATAGGAQALGRDTGRLAPGRFADIVVLDRDHPNLAAVQGDRWLDAYVFTSAASAVREVFAGGRKVVEGGRHIKREDFENAYKRTLNRILGAI